MSPTPPSIRRIVTGHGEDRIARAIEDGVATNAKQAGNGAVSTLIWSTDRTPADIKRSAPISRTWGRASSAPSRRPRGRGLP